MVANGKPGDHPLTDVITHGLPAFDPVVDGLIREIESEQGWNGEIKAAFMLDEQGRLRRLREAGDDEGARILLNNLRFLLEAELRQLRSTG